MALVWQKCITEIMSEYEMNPHLDTLDERPAEIQDPLFPETLGAFVRERALAMGEKVLAIWFEDGASLTYRQLDDQSDKLACSLLALGVRKNTHVAVMLPNTLAYPVTWIAIAKIGAVMVPINPAYTSSEILFILEDSDAQFLVVHNEYVSRVEEILSDLRLLKRENIILHGSSSSAGDMLSWDDLLEKGEAPFVAPSAVCRNDLLSIQFTSGTTGFPKGCMLSHDYWLVISAQYFFEPRQDEIENALIWAPFFYLDGQRKFLEMMRVGATMYTPRVMSLSKFLTWVWTYEIQYTTFPEPLLKRAPPEDRDKDIPLRFVDCYGWRKESRRQVEERYRLTARDTYGMTEIGVHTFMPLEAGDMAHEASCGVASAYSKLRIVDDSGKDVRPGESGELWAAGRGVMWGYYKRPAANAESFRGGWFRTGDIFYQDAKGYFYIVGRLKDTIKRSGENIAAREVERVLCAMDEIEDAAVVGVPDIERNEEVKAYVKLRAGVAQSEAFPDKIVAHCSKYLARFKIPRYIMYVDDFPRTPGGKIAKKTLKAHVPDSTHGVFDCREGAWV